MKKILSLLMVAFMATMAVSCNKDDDKNKDNNPPQGLSDNTLVYDGTVYNGESGVQFLNGSLQYALFNHSENGFELSGNIESSAYNRTFDLTQHHADFMFTVHINVGEILDLKFQNYPQNFWCFLNGESLENTSCFRSGTATVTMNNGQLTVVVEGVLINGKELKYKVVASQSAPGPSSEVTPNGLVIGDQQYQLHPTLSITNEGYYLFDARDPNGAYDIIADIPATLMNQTVNLAQLSGVDRFYINFQSTNLSFALQTGSQPISAINDEPVSAVFSEGTMEFTKENGVVVCKVSGTLSNGVFVGFMMNVSEEDIDAMDYQVILDGQAFEAEAIAWYRSDAGLPYEIRLVGQGDGAISLKVEFEPAAFNHDIGLTTTTTAYKYRVSVNFPDTTATQDAFDGTVQSSYWVISSQTEVPVTGCLFTRGTLHIDEDEYNIGFSLSGTLSNGHSVSGQVRLSKSEFQDPNIRK